MCNFHSLEVVGLAFFLYINYTYLIKLDRFDEMFLYVPIEMLRIN